MKNTEQLSILALLVMCMLSYPIHAKELKSDEDAEFKELQPLGEKFDSEGYEIPNSSNVRTMSNPKLRPVETLQQSEFVEYEAAGQIPSPYIKNGLTQGWLVNGCVVVAPRHAIIATGNVDKDLTNMQLDFKVGYQGKGSFKQQVKIKPISCGRGNNSDDLGGEDFCIFKTDRSLKGLVKPIKIGAIDYQRYSVVPTTSVGFFPQASKAYDVLAKDLNAKIVEGDSTYLESRAASVSGAGLIDIDEVTHDKHIIGLQVGAFKVVNSKRVIEEINAIRAKNANAFKCN